VDDAFDDRPSMLLCTRCRPLCFVTLGFGLDMVPQALGWT
jgi:hypothetical protein